MLISAQNSEVASNSVAPSDEQAAVLRMEDQLPPVLSVIAGMVDLTGFFMLGNIFTAHITGNLVVASALVVRGGLVNPAQLLAIPVFMIALALVWLIDPAQIFENGSADCRRRLGGEAERLVHDLLRSDLLARCQAMLARKNKHQRVCAHRLVAQIFHLVFRSHESGVELPQSLWSTRRNLGQSSPCGQADYQ